MNDLPSGDVRVRFAPSPTGYLHIGGARTALFNYLYARQRGGVLVLRVEDTDRERSTPEAVQAIFDGLRYLGLHWDEGPEVGGDHGPYFQSERSDTYGEWIARLLDERKIYPCFCSKERLASLRDAQRAAKARILYDRRCLELDASEVARRMEHEPYVLRFRVPPGEARCEDLIRGEVVVRNEEIEDFIVRRSDGSVVYNFAVVGDDYGMGITHVIRGEDHLSNTSKQLLLYEALGLPVPRYAHIPLILAPGGGKLSKRHGAVSVTEYEEKGYLPEAMLNFLVRMGWSFDDQQEIFSLAELVEKFSFGGVSKSGAVYDLKKLEHLGGHYMRERPLESVVELVIPRLVARGFVSEEEASADCARLTGMIALERERNDCLAAIVDKLEFYFAPVELDDSGRKVLRKKRDTLPLVERYVESLAALEESAWVPDDPSALDAHAREFVEREDARLGDLAQPVRALISGRNATPGLFEVIALLGRDATLERLGRAAELYASAAPAEGKGATKG